MSETAATPPNDPFRSLFKQIWWIVLIRGILAVLFGIVALVWPGITVWALVVVFGIYAIIDGIVLGYHAVRDRRTWTAGAGGSRRPSSRSSPASWLWCGPARPRSCCSTSSRSMRSSSESPVPSAHCGSGRSPSPVGVVARRGNPRDPVRHRPADLPRWRHHRSDLAPVSTRSCSASCSSPSHSRPGRSRKRPASSDAPPRTPPRSG